MRNRNLLIPVLLLIMLNTGTIASRADEAPLLVCHGEPFKKPVTFHTITVNSPALKKEHREDHKDQLGRCLRDLVPNESRWFRGLTFKAYSLDQPDTLFDSMGDSMPNPYPELKKYEISLDLSKVFWSTDELVNTYQLAASTKDMSLIDARSFKSKYLDVPTAKNVTAQDATPRDATARDATAQEVLAFFARSQEGKKFRRFASAWTFSTAQSERSEPGPGDDKYEETYGFTFDPKKLFVTADRALAAYKGLDAYRETHKGPIFTKEDKHGFEMKVNAVSDPTSVLRNISGLPIMSQGLVGLIPAIEFKSVDQFDFLKSGSVFAPSFSENPLIEGSIETITFTWTLSVALDTTKKRRDAMKAIVLHKKLIETDIKEAEKNTPKILPKAATEWDKAPRFCVGDFLYLQLTREPAADGSQWVATSVLPKGLVLQRNGLLRGYFEKEGSKEFKVTVKHKDNYVDSERKIVVEMCNQTNQATQSGKSDQ